MGQTNFIVSLLFLGAVVALLSRRSTMLDALIDGINEIADNFRGGPPTPMRPSPADDGALLRKRKTEK